MRGFVVTGTDTEIGKTVFAAGLAGLIGGRYWKPVQAGDADDTDTDLVLQLSDIGTARVHPEAYCLRTPCSPHQAAAIDGVEIDLARLALPEGEGPLVVEGAGGALVPLRRDLLFADVFARWGLPVVLVARTGLGTINHSLLSVEALRARSVPLHGIAFVGEENAETENTICAIGELRHLGRLPKLDPLDQAQLSAAMHQHFDIEDFV